MFLPLIWTLPLCALSILVTVVLIGTTVKYIAAFDKWISKQDSKPQWASSRFEFSEEGDDNA